MDENEDLELILETVFHKWTSFDKRAKKKAIRRAHKGSNWGSTKAREGYKRVKIPGTKRYVLVKQSAMERITKRKVGHGLGVRKELR
jgi:hypothetical protein